MISRESEGSHASFKTHEANKQLIFSKLFHHRSVYISAIYLLPHTTDDRWLASVDVIDGGENVCNSSYPELANFASLATDGFGIARFPTCDSSISILLCVCLCFE